MATNERPKLEVDLKGPFVRVSISPPDGAVLLGHREAEQLVQKLVALAAEARAAYVPPGPKVRARPAAPVKRRLAVRPKSR